MTLKSNAKSQHKAHYISHIYTSIEYLIQIVVNFC